MNTGNLIRSFGYRYVTVFAVWKKVNEDGTTYQSKTFTPKFTSPCFEYILLARKGDITPLLRDTKKPT